MLVLKDLPARPEAAGDGAAARGGRLKRRALLGLWLGLLLATPALAADEATLARQAAAFRADAAKTILDLQPFRDTEQLGNATLISVNPQINRWFLLSFDRPGSEHHYFHLENPDPTGQQVHLRDGGLQLTIGGSPVDCPFLPAAAAGSLQAAQRSGNPDAPLCDGKLYLRNQVTGRSTTLELVTDLLRDHIWGGDEIVSMVRQQFYADRFIEHGEQGNAAAAAAPTAADAPNPPLVHPLAPGDHRVWPSTLGIAVDRPLASLAEGQWYPAAGLPGVHVSYAQPQRLAPEGLKPGSLNAMDPTEADALVYFVSFDLTQYQIGYAVGTEHPRLGWSDRASTSGRGNMPGPDGVESPAPLVMTGVVNPWLASRTVATFAGGFKRQHGAFKYGELSERNHSTHYGFIEQGAILSKLEPGLATLYVQDDGTIDMKTWHEEDDALLPHIVDARQNGVPLIEYDAQQNHSAPGPLVARWGPGNWSGTAEEKLRSVRAGLCLQETETRRFLIYGYFSSTTPSTMARVFQAYRCKYAMHLDMNALEHTYFALYRHAGTQLGVEHLVNGMGEADTESDGGLLPRFLEMPDDRDFFYLTRRETAK